MDTYDSAGPRFPCLRRAFAIFFSAIFLLASVFSTAQKDPAKRKILNSAPPAYPTLARSMALSGVVKVDAFVAPDGSVKAVDIKGGHPVLAQAAANSIRRWKWESTAHESHELVEIRFSPPE
jgi:TonB family protein